ncbi:uncharacterized protein LOC141828145 [Curcuma longa]|uniref:uncharacterized protein LOC141828145 n=1 Tax=Curcuma longa TaxID=136217 RepID=UPI003D9F1CC5
MQERPAAHSFSPSASTGFADNAGSGDDDDFEFTFPTGGAHDEPIVTADELFSNGRILPIYPAFDRALAFHSLEEDVAKPPARQIPIRWLLVEESESRSGSISSSSSLEADDLASAAAREYRPRTVRSAPQSPEWRRECTSTETSRRWKLWDTLFGRRSHSDGKKKSMFLEFPSSPPLERRSPRPSQGPNPKPAGSWKAAREPRRSFLPYRSELFGFFNGRTRRPFY